VNLSEYFFFGGRATLRDQTDFPVPVAILFAAQPTFRSLSCRKAVHSLAEVVAMKRFLPLSLLVLLALALAGCRDQNPIEPIPISEPSFYNVGGNYWLVTKLDDTNDGTCDADCSLREAIAIAAAGDEIRFGVAGTITLTATLQVNKNLTITGPGAGQLTVSGDDAYRVFAFGANVTASLSGLTIADGSADNGGGISKAAGSLTLTDCVVRDNAATGVGGGIYQPTGTLTLTNCVVSGNQAALAGGILSYGGGVISITESTISGNTATTNHSGGMYAYLSNVTLERSTLSGNIAQTNGGAARFQLGSTTIRNSTISGNTASTVAGAIDRFGGSTRIVLSTITDNNAATGTGGVYLEGGAQMDVKGSIIWGNTRSGTIPNDVGGTAAGYNSLGYNLIGAGNGATQFTADGDQAGVDALLSALAENGGPTQTHSLLAGSPAIDAGTCTDDAAFPVLTDQRGVTRPQGITCDIGAYELSPAEAVESLMDYVKALGPDGTGRLNKGQTNSLLVTLNVVLKKLEKGQSHVALDNLRVFISEVETFTADRVLSRVEGQRLIDAAEQIVAAVEAM
jgi:CSLREA domain-containing protein